MTSRRTLPEFLRGRPTRLPEAALRRAVAQAASLAQADGRARQVLFDAAKRRVLVDDQARHARRPSLTVVAVIAAEARS
jgi:hypothetical protein